MSLPKTSPQEFCTAFIARELKDCQEKKIWMSSWPIMQRMLDRSDELQQVFDELISKFDYSDKCEGITPSNAYIWLILEHIWRSSQYAKEDVTKARQDLKRLNSLREDIEEQTWRLAATMRECSDLYEKSGFIGRDFRSLVDTIQDAGNHNYLFKSEVSDELDLLDRQYEGKYWPSCIDLVEQIAIDHSQTEELSHMSFPPHVIEGRASDIKDFVLGFDDRFKQINGLPTGFSFSHAAMAEIMNIVLDCPVEQLVTPEAVKLVRHRYKDGAI